MSYYHDDDPQKHQYNNYDGGSYNDRPPFKILAISVILLIAYILFLYHLSLPKNKTQESPDYPDYTRVNRVLALVNSKLTYGNNNSLSIDYSKYGISKDQFKTNCVDFAFAFAILYGTPARVAISSDHAFVVIGKEKFEPQSEPKRFMFDHQLGLAMDYTIQRTIDEFSSEDRKIIRTFFWGE
jgi:hypothetical protein